MNGLNCLSDYLLCNVGFHNKTKFKIVIYKSFKTDLNCRILKWLTDVNTEKPIKKN